MTTAHFIQHTFYDFDAYLRVGDPSVILVYLYRLGAPLIVMWMYSSVCFLCLLSCFALRYSLVL